MSKLFDIVTEKPVPKIHSMTDHKPCYFYHVSHSINDKYKKVFPQYVTGENEVRLVKRFCVAPTLEQCLVALCDYPTGDDCEWSIYRSKHKISSSVRPSYVHDFALTQERWVTDGSINMVKVGSIKTEGYSRIKVGEGESESFRLNFSARGNKHMLPSQCEEYTSIKEFVSDHASKLFFNEKEIEIHNQQRRLRLRINR